MHGETIQIRRKTARKIQRQRKTELLRTEVQERVCFTVKWNVSEIKKSTSVVLLKCDNMVESRYLGVERD
jgi:hypothetical protein